MPVRENVKDDNYSVLKLQPLTEDKSPGEIYIYIYIYIYSIFILQGCWMLGSDWL